MTESSAPQNQTSVDVIGIQDAAAKAALARETERRREIRGLLFGVHARNPALVEVMNACLDDPECTREMASQRLLRKLGESAEPLMGANYSGSAAGWAVQPSGFTMPSGGLAREFHAAERAARIGNPVAFGGFGSTEFIRAASDALALRFGARLKTVHPAAQDFRETPLTGILAMSLAGAGRDPTGMSRSGIVKSFMTSADLPDLLSAAVNKSLVSRFEAISQEHRQLCDFSSLTDFKESKQVNLSFLPGLERKYEGGEVKFGSISDGSEIMQLFTYARILGFTREMMINDHEDGISAAIRTSANSAARLERDLIFGALTTNAAMADGISLFDSGHNNLDSSSKAIDVAGLSAARVLMRKQRDSNGGYVHTRPRFVVTPVALESAAESLIAALTYSPAAGSEIETPQWIRGLVPISDPRLDDSNPSDWFLLSDPDAAPVLRLGYLNGIREPVVEQEIDFNKDVLKFKVRFDVSVGVVGFSGSVKMT